MSGTVFAIRKYRQHLKNKPSDSQKAHQISTDTNLHEETQFYDEVQGNESTNIPPDSHSDGKPGTQPTLPIDSITNQTSVPKYKRNISKSAQTWRDVNKIFYYYYIFKHFP